MKISKSISSALVAVLFVQLAGNTMASDATICESEVNAFSRCFEANIGTCGIACSSDDDVQDMSDDFGNTIPTCSDINTAFCSQFDCCPACFNQLEAYGECIVRSAGIRCDLECSGAPPAGVLWGSVAALVGVAHFMLG